MAAKVCGVCGDRALGFNFNAVTCESCKAFFRRNALKRKDYKCPFDENCKIDTVTRRFCQKCRLQKCFSIGMKKEWIMSEEEKRSKKAKIENNRIKKTTLHSNRKSNRTKNKERSSPLSPIWFSNDTNGSPKPSSKIKTIHDPVMPLNSENSCNNLKRFPIDKKENNDVYLSRGVILSECNVVKVSNDIIPISNLEHDSSSLMPNTPINTLAEIDKSHWQENSKTQETKCNISNEYTSPSTYGYQNSSFSHSHQIVSSLLSEKDDLYLPSTSNATRNSCSRNFMAESNIKQFGELESKKLQELIMANEILKMPLSGWIPDPHLLDVINMTELAIRRLIKMSTRISGFRNLCQDDQIALLKGGCTELMILRSVMSYDPEKECWKGPGGPKLSIKMDVLKEAKGNVYKEHKRFINSFHSEWRTNENIMLLLGAITLFMPERPCTVHKDVIKMEQEIYYYLLLKYLNTVYAESDASVTYLKLIDILKELHILNEDHIRVYLDVNPKDVEPLLIEIFDLKH